MCAVHCVQLLHTLLHRTDLIIFPLALQTITIAPMMSIWGKGNSTHRHMHACIQASTQSHRHTDRINLLYDESVPALNEPSQVALALLVVRLTQDQSERRRFRDCTERSQEVVCLPPTNQQHSSTTCNQAITYEGLFYPEKTISWSSSVACSLPSHLLPYLLSLPPATRETLENQLGTLLAFFSGSHRLLLQILLEWILKRQHWMSKDRPLHISIHHQETVDQNTSTNVVMWHRNICRIDQEVLDPYQ